MFAITLPRTGQWSAVFALVAALAGCATTSMFDETAYGQAVLLKAESLALMDQAGEPYENHRAEVSRLLRDLDQARAHARSRPGNQASAAQWTILDDPGRSLVAGFFVRWAAQDSLSRVFIAQSKAVVADAFDAIAALESGKKRP